MPADLTIEQLAARSGMSVRNIRAHQARGLLDPPEVRLRVGYYGPEHVERLQAIRELQDEGFNLAGIKRLLDDDQGSAERLARLKRSVTSREGEEPQVVDSENLRRRLGLSGSDAPALLARAQGLGVLRQVDDSHWEVPSPSLLEVAEKAVSQGLSLKGALSAFEEIRDPCESVSAAFVQLFVDEVWRPFQEAGMPLEQWPEMEGAIESLRPLAREALLATFGTQMGAQIEAAFGRPLERAEVDED